MKLSDWVFFLAVVASLMVGKHYMRKADLAEARLEECRGER